VRLCTGTGNIVSDDLRLELLEVCRRSNPEPDERLIQVAKRPELGCTPSEVIDQVWTQDSV